MKPSSKIWKTWLVFAGLIALAIFATRWLAIDRCLDGGGVWNYERGTCIDVAEE